jgi:two-component system cell cycle response regulator
MIADKQLQTTLLAILFLLSASILFLLAIQNYRYGLFELVYSASFLCVLFLGVSAYARFTPEAKYLPRVCFWAIITALLVIMVDSFTYPNELQHWAFPLGLLSYIALSHRQATLLNAFSAAAISVILFWEVGLVSALTFATIYTFLISLASTYAQLHQRRSRSLVALAVRDPLTNAYNFRHLQDTLKKEICRADRTGKPLSLISLTIDYLPQVFNLHGVSTTNTLLTEFSETLRAMIRAGDSDYCDKQHTAYLLLPCTPSAGVLVIAERIRRTIEETNWPVVDAITVSLGCTSYVPNKEDVSANKLIDDANIALIEAQKNGHNRVCHHSY